jgi:predicted RNA-binding protein with PIN domain
MARPRPRVWHGQPVPPRLPRGRLVQGERGSSRRDLIIPLIIQTIRRDRRGTQPEQGRSDWSRPDRRRAPGYGSGGSKPAMRGEGSNDGHRGRSSGPGKRRDRPAARWLIDGMNLIGSRPDRWWKDPDRAVRRLIGELDRYAAATGEDITVVFDRQPPEVPSGAHGTAMVAFASWRGRDAADHEIVRMLAEDRAPHSVGVVTSDRRLVERARQLGAGVTSSTSSGTEWTRCWRARPPRARELACLVYDSSG